MPRAVACLSASDLRKLLLGTLPAEQAAAAEEHLSSCAACQRAAAAHDDNDPFIAALRSAVDFKMPDTPSIRSTTAKARNSWDSQKESTTKSISDEDVNSEVLERLTVRGPNRATTRGSGRKPPRRLFIAAAGAAAFALVLWGVIVIVRNQDGKEIARLNANEGVSVEVLPSSSPTKPQPSAAPTTATRTAAPIATPTAASTPASAIPTSSTAAPTPEPGEFDATFPGLLPAPAKIPGLKRMQLETRSPRGRIIALDWSRDGKSVLIGSSEGIVRTFDARTLRLTQLLHVASPQSTGAGIVWPSALRANPTQDLTAVARPGNLRLLEATGAIRAEFPIARAFNGDVSVAWSPDGKKLAYLGEDLIPRILRLDANTTAELPDFASQPSAYVLFGWSPDGRWLAYCKQNDPEVRLVDEDGKPGPRFGTHPQGYLHLSWSHDAQKIALLSRDESLFVYDLTGKQLWTVAQAGVSIAWNPKSPTLACVALSKRGIQLYDAEGKPGAFHRDPIDVFPNVWSPLVWSPDGEQLAVARNGDPGSLTGYLHVWTPKSNQAVTLDHPPDVFSDVSWSSNSNEFYTATGSVAAENQVNVRRWQATMARSISLKTLPGKWGKVAVAPDGETVAVSVNWGPSQLLTRDGDKKAAIETKPDVYALSWSSDGAQLAVGTGRIVRLIGSDGKTQKDIGAAAFMSALERNGDGRYLATFEEQADKNLAVRILDSTGATIATIPPPPAAKFDGRCLHWRPGHPDQLATADEAHGAGRVRVWNIDGTEVKLFSEVGSPWMAWSPDGQRFAAAYAGNSILQIGFGFVRIVDWDRGLLGVVRTGLTDEPTTIEWSKDGRWIVCASKNAALVMIDAEALHPVWGAVSLGGDQVVSYSAAGKILDGDPTVIEKEMVYHVEADDGRREILSPAEFAKRFAGSFQQVGETSPTHREMKSLFNGRDLSGWTVVGPDAWSVQDGAIVAKETGQVGWLMSDRDYSDFELELQYKLSPASNSGVFLRAWPEGDVGGKEFHEINLQDDQAFPQATPDRKDGALYSQLAPNPTPQTPLNEWNRLRITVRGRRVTVETNGARTLEGTLRNDRPEGGRIGLQVNRGRVEFRDVRLRELPNPVAVP